MFVYQKDKTKIIFQEKGEWEESRISFSNTLQWTLYEDSLTLEHLRWGIPLQLVELTSDSDDQFSSVQPHKCGNDTYDAKISWDPRNIHFTWSVQGPQKNYTIHCCYE